jgi:hypothetical protein
MVACKDGSLDCAARLSSRFVIKASHFSSMISAGDEALLRLLVVASETDSLRSTAKGSPTTTDVVVAAVGSLY